MTYLMAVASTHQGYTGDLHPRGSMEDHPRSPPSTPEAGHDHTSTLYKELHRVAVCKIHFERGDHTLQPTALVNESYLRLADYPGSVWVDRTQILGLAAGVMRHILVTTARAWLRQELATNQT
jgi:hypothetical protein